MHSSIYKTHSSQNLRIQCDQTIKHHHKRPIIPARTTKTHVTSDTSYNPSPTWPSDAARRAAFSSTDNLPSTSQALITGQFPPWLKGQYLRNGPGTFNNGTPSGMSHLFDGFALILSFHIDGTTNTVTGNHKFLQSHAYKEYLRTGYQQYREFATPAATTSTLSGKVADIIKTSLGAMGIGQGFTDNASVNVIPLSNDSNNNVVIACTETVLGTFKVDKNNLNTIGRIQYTDEDNNKPIKGDLTTAHPIILPNGDHINIINNAGFGESHIYRVSPSSSIRHRIATIKQRNLAGSWIHSFPCNGRFAIIPETPLYFNLINMMVGIDSEYLFLDWKPTDGTVLHIVDLEGVDKVKSVRIGNDDGAFYVFHYSNCYTDDSGLLHIDGAVYPDPEIVNDLLLKNLRKGPPGGGGSGESREVSASQLMRMTLDVSSLFSTDDNDDKNTDNNIVKYSEQGKLWQHLTNSLGSFEFPAIHPGRKFHKYKYVWGVCAVRPTNVGNGLCKVDVETGESKVWTEEGIITGEPVFVPTGVTGDGVEEEDDGVLLSVIVQNDGLAALVALDGRNMVEIARAVFPYTLTTGFHGCWINGE